MRLDEAETVELARPRDRADREGRMQDGEQGGGFARTLAGSLAAGLVLLALALVVAEWLTESKGVGGPGIGTLIAHGVAAVAAVVAAVVADRRRGMHAALAVATVALITALLLWFYWFS